MSLVHEVMTLWFGGWPNLVFCPLTIECFINHSILFDRVKSSVKVKEPET